MARIGFIGMGEIAQSMVYGLRGNGHELIVSPRNANRAKTLAENIPEVSIAPNQVILDQSEYVVLCLMKDHAKSELPDLLFRKDHKIISVMADVPLMKLEEICAPATDISITIPLPFVSSGKCPLPVYPDTGSVSEVFGKYNFIMPMTSEKALSAHFAATAMASVVFSQMQVGVNWLAQSTGDDALAEAYIISMLGGYVSTMQTDGNGRIQEALIALSTEGGLNATLRDHMADNDVLDTLKDGLDNFRTRLGL